MSWATSASPALTELVAGAAEQVRARVLSVASTASAGGRHNACSSFMELGIAGSSASFQCTKRSLTIAQAFWRLVRRLVEKECRWREACHDACH